MTDTTNIKKKNGLLGAVGWLAAIVLGCWATVIAHDHGLAAALLAAAAVLALPPVQRRAAAAMKSGTPRWYLVVIPACLALIGIGLGAVPSPEDVEEAKDPVASVVRYQARHIGATQPCKESFQAISDEALSASPDRQRMYDMASTAQGRCRAARDVLSDMDGPKGLTMEEGARFAEAAESCNFAYMLAEQAAGKLKTALDGGMAPSQVAAFRDTANQAVGYRRTCDAQLIDASNLAVAAHRNQPAD